MDKMTLKDWISSKSPKPIIGRLPISTEKFAKFLFPGILKGNMYQYDKLFHKKLCNQISALIGENRMNIVHKMGMMLACELTSKSKMFTEPEKYNDVFKEVMDTISEMPLWIFDDAIGHGFTGTVYNFDGNHVIKIFYTKLNQAERQWVSFQAKNSLEIFPYINDWGANYIIMETLSTDSCDLMDVKNLISNTTVHIFEQEVGYRILNANYNETPLWFKSFINNICRAMNDCFGVKTIGDLTISNVAIRPTTQEYVLMDPIDGLLSKKIKTEIQVSESTQPLIPPEIAFF